MSTFFFSFSCSYRFFWGGGGCSYDSSLAPECISPGCKFRSVYIRSHFFLGGGDSPDARPTNNPPPRPFFFSFLIQGFDIAEADVVLTKGTVLGAAEIGLLATVGNTHVTVYRQPVVGLMSTGDEIVDPDTPTLAYGQIRDSNRSMLRAALIASGAIVKDFGIVMDQETALREKLEQMSAECDMLITSGGVSMGERDLIKATILELQGTIQFGRVFMKPGKPTTFATIPRPGSSSPVLFFGLPGNPVSCLVTFHLFVVPALRASSGWTNSAHRMVKVRTSTDIFLDPRPEFQRASLDPYTSDGVPIAASTGSQCSSRLLSMRSAGCLLVVPPATEALQTIPAGSLVDAILL
eukprot:m.170821 g.170821  ORF g.170821 m.170821 type:complete len:351 (-) comp16490_c1_seq1:205-1257(-)